MSKKDDLKKFQKESLEAHNDYRAAHGTPKLKLADDLNKIAQAYADQLAKTDSFRHSKRDGLGENLAMHFSSESTNYSGGEATQQWYSEIEKYNFDRCGFTPGTGHFTQVIWAETKELGVGKAITKSGKVLAVANYRPAGNMIGKFRENVLPLKKSRSVDLTKHSCTRRSSSSSSDDEQKSKKMLGLFKKKENDANSTDISKSDVKKFQKEMLAAHNKHREKHGVPPLKLSDEVCKDAQRHAEKLAKTGHLEHSNNHEYGENVGMHYSSATTEYSGTEATNQWYSEVSKYDFCDPRFKSGIGHFTQVVWKGSKELGVGKAITKDGKVIFVANYKPPGNMSGDFDKNVFPEGHKPSKDDDKEKKGLFRKGDSLSKSDIKEFQQDALETHNEYRVKHGVPKLKASDELNKHSQKWAEHLAKTGKFEHSDQRKYGENIAMHYSSESTEYSGKEASDHWYSELRNYDFKKPAFSQGTGHFSQMVWKNSTQFGIGKAITKDKRVVVVASYEPAGNYIGQFPDNVFNRTDGYVPPKPEGVKEVKIVKPVDDCKMQAKDFKAVPDDLKTFRKDALNSHNAYRSTHKAPALKESSELTKMAQEWAEHLATKGLFEHRDSSDTGENIAMHYSSASTSFSGKEATDMWYSEVSKHDFSKQFQPGTGHFTQVVWKGSKEFGIGKAITKEGKVIIVGNYRPPGNMMSKFNENVFKGK